ncbi:Acetoin dehydrogenase E1 component alpha-subunit (EC [Olavius algarvensis Delta 1 endosymbiont]|nr:Acetoin dehydrogenase E1 component alpha-subunit (EC [Olavius algarvensis Delta 1 endosymbiont]
MQPDLWFFYEHMFRSRLFEEAVTRLWNEGRISGEMHLSTGEEAIVAGTVLQLQDGDAMALDHRGISPMVMRGVDMVLLLREFLGSPEGLCRGRGGHMHLFSRPHLAASSGIVGASGPTAAGFALAARHLRPGTVALAFFGEGAMNQGMLLESMNLAVVWNLPVVFVCKDSQWAITTVSATVTGGKLVERAAGFGLPARKIDGTDVETMWSTAGEAIKRARAGKGPTFLLANCPHPEGHFLGDPLLRIARNPVKEMQKVAGPLVKSVTRVKGGSVAKRTGGLGKVTAIIGKTTRDRFLDQKEPLKIARSKLKKDKARLTKIENSVEEEIRKVVADALELSA